MKSINLGHIQIVFDNTLTNFELTPQPSNPELVIERVSLRELQQSVPFKILQPNLLPSTGLALARVYRHKSVASSPPRFISSALKYRSDAQTWFVLEQWVIDKVRKFRISHEMVEGTIADHVAAFYTYPVKASAFSNGQVNVTHCLWEHDEFLFKMRSNGFTLQELGRVGESLA